MNSVSAIFWFPLLYTSPSAVKSCLGDRSAHLIFIERRFAERWFAEKCFTEKLFHRKMVLERRFTEFFDWTKLHACRLGWTAEAISSSPQTFSRSIVGGNILRQIQISGFWVINRKAHEACLCQILVDCIVDASTYMYVLFRNATGELLHVARFA